jgi:hypothetical protein
MDSLEAQIKETFLSIVEDNTTFEKEILLGNLEKERNKILSYNEEKWRQRSRAIWIRSMNLLVYMVITPSPQTHH